MGAFFGTDGIRGKINYELTKEIAEKCGNALAQTKQGAKVIIGTDTRLSCDLIVLALSVGLVSGGAYVDFVGVCPTAGISYLTKSLGYDYGVVVSASHNPPEYNGIKIFNSQGVKLGDELEEELEKLFAFNLQQKNENLGKFNQKFDLVKKYEKFLNSCVKTSFKDMLVVIDGSNGAGFSVAPNVFVSLGAKVKKINCKNDGKNINNNCGALFVDSLKTTVKKFNANLGVALDGDSDRVILIDEQGNEVDGDLILYLLANQLKKEKKLKNNSIVGTRHTNIGIEQTLKNNGVTLCRTDIGDKYVIAKMFEEDLSLGGEQSGHIIIRDYLETGDGILAGLKVAETMVKTNKKLSDLTKVELCPQVNINCVVKDKLKVINSEELSSLISKKEKELGSNSRIMVRVSGTEPKVRIMVEDKREEYAKLVAKEIADMVNFIDQKI